ncbi:hypothetical protein [Marinimicrobium sp. ABcell2]|uniref:hypothetical protein n=1 Tax=Marinimicrobium sp. ABcell2 TaxID=3069751 RepID=UPI0027B2EDB6|nr:hypothetical protein [Marinimicrobium sp. ABcell2]MDQ2075941.1 hypothetical protein [Marinimicrobium sp. ABcell2]
MKTFYAILASMLLALGSSAMAATGAAGDRGTAGERGAHGDQDFTELDRDGEGFIDEDAAQEAGISEEEFQEMDRDGDGRVTEEEFRQHQQDRAYDRDDNDDDNGLLD